MAIAQATLVPDDPVEDGQGVWTEEVRCVMRGDGLRGAHAAVTNGVS